MVFLDSNLFIIDRFFPGDFIYKENKIFLDTLPSIDAAISIFTLLELCGAASFRLSSSELDSWLFRFQTAYPVLILDMDGLENSDAYTWWERFVIRAAGYLSKRMTLGDALLLMEAENYSTDALITWNTKDFFRRTKIPVMTPTAFLSHRRHY